MPLPLNPFSTTLEIDLRPRVVRDMLDKRGFYVVGDKTMPGVEYPVVSVGGQLHMLSANGMIDPAQLGPTFLAVGPYRLQSTATKGKTTTLWDEKVEQVVAEVEQLWAGDRARYREGVQDLVREAMRWAVGMPIPESEWQIPAEEGET